MRPGTATVLILNSPIMPPWRRLGPQSEMLLEAVGPLKVGLRERN